MNTIDLGLNLEFVGLRRSLTTGHEFNQSLEPLMKSGLPDGFAVQTLGPESIKIRRKKNNVFEWMGWIKLYRIVTDLGVSLLWSSKNMSNINSCVCGCRNGTYDHRFHRAKTGVYMTQTTAEIYEINSKWWMEEPVQKQAPIQVLNSNVM